MVSSVSTLDIGLDTSEVDFLLSSLREELDVLPEQTRDGFVRRYQALAQPFYVDPEQLAGRMTRDVRFVVKPSASLLDLVRKFHTGALDCHEISKHPEVP